MGHLVDVDRGRADPLHGGLAVSVLAAARGESIDCLGPWGIPLAHSMLGQTWQTVALELRQPIDAEIGVPLVQARPWGVSAAPVMASRLSRPPGGGWSRLLSTEPTNQPCGAIGR